MKLHEIGTKTVFIHAKTVTLVDVNGDKLPIQDIDDTSIRNLEVMGTSSSCGHLTITLPIGEKKPGDKKVPRYTYKIEVYCTPIEGKFQWNVLQRDLRDTFGGYSKIACGVAGGEWDAFQQALARKNKYEMIYGGTL